MIPPPAITSKATAAIRSVGSPRVVVLGASAAAAAAGALVVPAGVPRGPRRPPRAAGPGPHRPRPRSGAVPRHHQRCGEGHHHHRCHHPWKEGEGVAVWVDKRLPQVLADVPPATWSILSRAIVVRWIWWILVENMYDIAILWLLWWLCY